MVWRIIEVRCDSWGRRCDGPSKSILNAVVTCRSTMQVGLGDRSASSTFKWRLRLLSPEHKVGTKAERQEVALEAGSGTVDIERQPTD